MDGFCSPPRAPSIAWHIASAPISHLPPVVSVSLLAAVGALLSPSPVRTVTPPDIARWMASALLLEPPLVPGTSHQLHLPSLICGIALPILPTAPRRPPSITLFSDSGAVPHIHPPESLVPSAIEGQCQGIPVLRLKVVVVGPSSLRAYTILLPLLQGIPVLRLKVVAVGPSSLRAYSILFPLLQVRCLHAFHVFVKMSVTIPGENIKGLLILMEDVMLDCIAFDMENYWKKIDEETEIKERIGNN